MLAALWTASSPARFGMHSWRRASPKSSAGSPNPGMITFGIRGKQDLKHALWLMRLLYLPYSHVPVAPRQDIDRPAQSV